MEFALGVKGYSEEEFWRSTPYGLSCAYIGHCKAKGLGRWERKADGWTDVEIEDHRAEVERLQQEFAAEQAKAAAERAARRERKMKKAKADG